MSEVDRLTREVAELRDRLARLSEANLRANESLDLDTVLSEVVESACSLTQARYGVITAVDSTGDLQAIVTCGFTPEEYQGVLELPDGPRFFEHLGSIGKPLRVPDLNAYFTSQGLPQFRPPVMCRTFLSVPILLRGAHVGTFYVGEKGHDREFSREDEELLEMFASQAAAAIANAGRYKDEQRARADLEALINTCPVGVAVFDARVGEMTWMNREARRIVGDLLPPNQSEEEILKVLTYQRADGREVSLDQFPLPVALNEGETVRSEEFVMSTPDGSSVTALINATPIRSDSGDVESMVVTLQDMTPIKELERLRAEFLGMVSHELRAPLISIKGSATTLLDNAPTLEAAEMHQLHRIISEQADNMRSLINDLLDMARIESGTLSVTPEPVDPSLLVEEARSTLLGPRVRNAVQIDLPPGLPHVMADRRRIVQVLINLLSNAAKYSREPSPIRLTVAQDGMYVEFSVADEGRGLPPDLLPHLFSRFSRLKEEDHVGGTTSSGLGLAICKGIVEAHGGRIWAESAGLGEGARFAFTIPAVDVEVVAGTGQSVSGQNAQSTTRHRTRILAVDDDPHALRYIRDVLTKAGYAPVVTGDPEEVSHFMETEKPHAVLLDMVLPGVDGTELMKRVHEAASVPVIFVSVYGQEDIIAKALDMGAADYIVKPFSPTELGARIRAAIRKYSTPHGADSSVPYSVGDLTIDYSGRRVTVAGSPVRLTAIEYGLLVELSLNAGRVLTYDQLLQRVWGQGRSGEVEAVRVVVAKLRRKLGDNAGNPAYIATVHRVGYRMVSD